MTHDYVVYVDQYSSCITQNFFITEIYIDLHVLISYFSSEHAGMRGLSAPQSTVPTHPPVVTHLMTCKFNEFITFL